MKAISTFVFVTLVVALSGCSARVSSDSPKVALAMQMQEAVLAKQDLKEIQRIIKSGFKVDDPIGCGTFNPVDGAVSVENMEILKFLLADGAQPKGSALLEAVRCRNPDVSFQMVAALLQAGADPNYKDYYMGDKNRFTSPLHDACGLGDFKVVQLLLSQRGIELNTVDMDGYTPLMRATRNGNKEIIRLLLAKGANPGVINSRGQTAGDMAQKLEILKPAASAPAAVMLN